MSIEEQLAELRSLVLSLVDREPVKEWYDIDEFARLVGKASFTVREWARLGRIRAMKRKSGRGAYASWVVAHAELLRYQKEGLAPLNRPNEGGAS